MINRRKELERTEKEKRREKVEAGDRKGKEGRRKRSQ